MGGIKGFVDEEILTDNLKVDVDVRILHEHANKNI